MSRSAEDLGFPGWVDAVVSLLAFIICAGIIYGAVAFVAYDLNPLNWGGVGRFALVVCEGAFLYAFMDAVNDDGDEE